MSELIIFSIIAASLAVYSALPEHRQLRREFALERKNYLTLLLSGAVIIFTSLFETYLQASDIQFRICCNYICLPIELWTQTIQTGAALLSITMVGSLFISTEGQVGDDRALAKLLRRLYSRKEFSTLSSVLLDLYDPLIKSGETAPQSSATAKGIITDNRLLDQFGQIDPEFAGKILSDNESTIDRKDFALRYFKRQLSNQTSLLYHEIERAQEGGGSYVPEESTVLLYNLFSNCSVARNVCIWNPAREATREHIQSISNSESNKYASSNLSSNRPEELYRDRTYVGIQFFDLMASAALTQEVEYHMYMTYPGQIGEELANKFELADDADPSDEFPNDYARLLYEVHTTLKQIVRNAASQNFTGRKAISSPGSYHEPDVLRYCLRSLLNVHQAVLLSENIPDKFKSDRTHELYELYKELDISNAQKSGIYADTLLHFITQNDLGNPVYREGQLEYLRLVQSHLGTYDEAKLLTGGRDQYEQMKESVSKAIDAAESAN